MIACSLNAMAQLPGDNCANAIELPLVSEYCSGYAAFTTQNYSSSNITEPACWSYGNDIWFSFMALGESASISVRGFSTSGSGGTMSAPTFSLFSTPNCISFIDLVCATTISNGLAMLNTQSLTIGATHYIRVKNEDIEPGSFELCFNSYFQTDSISSDCPTALNICDKTTKVLSYITGTGVLAEGEGSCLASIPLAETNSTWVSWVCDQPGTFTFELTPINASDDLDFALYRLNNGLGDCSNNELLRCCASGDFTIPSVCMGSTGLSLTATDLTENAGCVADSNKDNHVRYLDMSAGETYGLLVNNFTSTGNGFSISFGGTATLKGADADFDIAVADTSQNNDIFEFTDLSNSLTGTITSWEWHFGANATPPSETTQGPHTVNYSTYGTKVISLEIETAEGCKVQVVKSMIGGIVSTYETFQTGSIQISPNPAQDWIKAAWSGVDTPIEWAIIDITGKTIWQERNVDKKSNLIPTQSWPSGVYYLFVRLNDGTIRRASFVIGSW
jgi:Secretion system C-terminal sorting domain